MTGLRRNIAQTLYQLASEQQTTEWRRSIARRSISKTVMIRTDGREISAQTFDVSPHSIGVYCAQPLDAKARVSARLLDGGDHWNELDVVHCTPTDKGYKIGLIMACWLERNADIRANGTEYREPSNGGR